MKVKSISWSILYFGIMIGIQLVVAVAMMIFLGAYIAITKDVTSEEVFIIAEQVSQNGNFMMLISLITFVVAFSVFGLWYRFSMNRKVHQCRASLPRHILVAILIAFFFQPVADCILVGTSIIMPKIYENYIELIEKVIGNNVNPVLIIITVVIIGPIVEEIVFRGMMFRVLRKSFGFAWSAMIGALLFAIYHLNIVQGIYCLVFGWVLCYLYEKTRSLGVVIIAHMTFNASTFGWEWMMKWISNRYANYPWGVDVIIWGISFVIVLALMLVMKSERGISNDTSRFEQ